MLSIKKYTWLLHIGTMAVCAYFVAQAVSTYIASLLDVGGPTSGEVRAPSLAPSPVARPPFEDYQVITDRNVFNSEQAGGGALAEGEEGAVVEGEVGPAVKTGLDVTLVGTLVIGDGQDRRSSALVSSKSSKGGQAYFVDGEEGFAPNVRLTKVEKNRIEFTNGGRLEYLELEDNEKEKSIFASRDEVFGTDEKGLKTASKEPEKKEETAGEGGGPVVIDQKEMDDALSNLDRLYSEVRIVPYFKDGQSKGMKLLSVKPGSIISKLGVRRGDVLEKINGEELDIKKGMDLFGQMKEMKNFTIQIVRGGKNQTIEYEIR